MMEKPNKLFKNEDKLRLTRLTLHLMVKNLNYLNSLSDEDLKDHLHYLNKQIDGEKITYTIIMKGVEGALPNDRETVITDSD